MLMTHQQTSELAKPCMGSLHDPAALISPQFAPIFVTPSLIVLAIGSNQFYPLLLQSLSQWIDSRGRRSRAGVFAAGGLCGVVPELGRACLPQA